MKTPKWKVVGMRIAFGKSDDTDLVRRLFCVDRQVAEVAKKKKLKSPPSLTTVNSVAKQLLLRGAEAEVPWALGMSYVQLQAIKAHLAAEAGGSRQVVAHKFDNESIDDENVDDIDEKCDRNDPLDSTSTSNCDEHMDLDEEADEEEDEEHVGEGTDETEDEADSDEVHGFNNERNEQDASETSGADHNETKRVAQETHDTDVKKDMQGVIEASGSSLQEMEQNTNIVPDYEKIEVMVHSPPKCMETERDMSTVDDIKIEPEEPKSKPESENAQVYKEEQKPTTQPKPSEEHDLEQEERTLVQQQQGKDSSQGQDEQSGSSRLSSRLRCDSKIVEPNKTPKFDDLIGLTEAKKMLSFMLSEWGKKMNCMALWGPPGTGKTTVVEAAAALEGFHVLNVLDEDMVSMEKAADVFRMARAFGGPLVVIIDEMLDAGFVKSKHQDQDDDKRSKFLKEVRNTRLFSDENGGHLKIVAITNKFQQWDKGARSRFKEVYVSLPSVKERAELLEKIFKGDEIFKGDKMEGIDWDNIAVAAHEFNYRDLKRVREEVLIQIWDQKGRPRKMVKEQLTVQADMLQSAVEVVLKSKKMEASLEDEDERSN